MHAHVVILSIMHRWESMKVGCLQLVFGKEPLSLTGTLVREDLHYDDSTSNLLLRASIHVIRISPQRLASVEIVAASTVFCHLHAECIVVSVVI